MVTAELALGSGAAILLAVLLAWGLGLGVAQLAIADTAAEVARQAARSDEDAVARARADAPDGAMIMIVQHDGYVVVTVSLDVRPLGLRLPPITLTASAQVLQEPT